jgi:hypothetical protein
MSTREIEKRLTAIEQEIAHLKALRGLEDKAHPIHSIERIHGIFENDSIFQEAMRLGGEWRKSQRPKGRKPRAARSSGKVVTLRELEE